MVAFITGLATALPGAVTPTDELIAHAKRFACRSDRQEKILEQLYRRTEIGSRCSALNSTRYGNSADHMFTPPASEEDKGPSTSARMQVYAQEIKALAVSAAGAALVDAGVSVESVTHLVTVSCTGFDAPGFDIHLINELNLPRTIARTHVGFMGCHGAMNALRVADSFAKSDPNAVVLVCAAELCSLHFQYGWSSDNLVANSLFSDGAAAFVIQSRTANNPRWELIGSTSFVVPDTTDAMRWQIRDNGFGMHLSSAVPDLVTQWLPDFIASWLSGYNLSLSDILRWAVHPGGPRILDAVQESLRLSNDDLSDARSILSEYGNMSSPTVLFILDRMRQLQKCGEIVVLGFGPGLTIEAALLKYQ